jgi:hypothetical protein
MLKRWQLSGGRSMPAVLKSSEATAGGRALMARGFALETRSHWEPLLREYEE